MKLLEIVRGEKTSKQIIATSMALAKILERQQLLLVFAQALLEIEFWLKDKEKLINLF